MIVSYALFFFAVIAVVWRVGFGRKERKEAGRVLTAVAIGLLLIWAVSQ